MGVFLQNVTWEGRWRSGFTIKPTVYPIPISCWKPDLFAVVDRCDRHLINATKSEICQNPAMAVSAYKINLSKLVALNELSTALQ